MKKIIAFLIAAAPATLFAQQKQTGFTINGTGAVGSRIYLSYSGKLDSAEMAGGKYQFKGEVTDPGPAMLFNVSPMSAAARNPKNRVEIFLAPETFTVAHLDSFTHVGFTGSVANTDYAKLKRELDPMMAKIQELQTEYRAAYNVGDTTKMDAIRQQGMALTKTMKEGTLLAFAKSNPGSPIALYTLLSGVDGDIDPAVIEPIFTKLPAAVRGTESGVAFQGRIEAAKKTSVGAMAPEFTQADTAGKPVSLTAFRGHYVLIDFWASWCGPCRMENPNVVAAYHKFKGKGFRILGVSLDRPADRSKWVEAIQKDGLVWTQVSDLKFWNNEVAKLYGINAIPQNFLLDPQGRIIAKNLRGADLNQRLEKLYQ